MGTWIVLSFAPWLCLWLATLPPQVTLAPPMTCTKEQCLANPNAMSEPLAQCCRLELGCPCQFYSECGTFDNHIVPLNGSFYTDFARTLCTCKCDQKLECVTKVCPVLPKDCKDILTHIDGCPYCKDNPLVQG